MSSAERLLRLYGLPDEDAAMALGRDAGGFSSLSLRGRTCLIVTHRKAALSICSRTLTLREGRITEGETAYAG